MSRVHMVSICCVALVQPELSLAKSDARLYRGTAVHMSVVYSAMVHNEHRQTN
jgi:hypothetical protein